MNRSYCRFPNCSHLLALTIAVTSMLPNLCSGQTTNQDPLKRFQRELHKRVVRDQSTRKAIIKYKTKKSNSKTKDLPDSAAQQKSYLKLLKKASDTDQSNLNWLQEQIETHGFPSRETLGNKSADEFFLLILHADRDRKFQKHCLKSMRQSDSDWPERQSRLLDIRSKQAPPPRIKLPDAPSKKTKASGKDKRSENSEGQR